MTHLLFVMTGYIVLFVIHVRCHMIQGTVLARYVLPPWSRLIRVHPTSIRHLLVQKADDLCLVAVRSRGLLDLLGPSSRFEIIL